ncbi:hypothetical protein BaRGS_00009083 [Batillaria attramentaria]|uniref:VWFA domain-containing protein n=1 Tax=Batillaria attramentaria TaxID=370345 RepID=A0ABD0LJP4_9CAEN
MTGSRDITSVGAGLRSQRACARSQFVKSWSLLSPERSVDPSPPALEFSVTTVMRYRALLLVAALSGLAFAPCFDKVMDLFFVLDSSSSIYVEDYKQELQFLREVVTRFDISRDDTRIGALTFSDDFQVGFDLDRYRTKGELLAAIDERNLPYRTGVTNTDAAIRYVRTNQAFRDDITKVIVVITDGGSRSPGATAREAQLARDAGFYLAVVGVGQYLEEQEWRNIASDPDSEFIFNITNFRFLESLKDSMPRRVCLLPPIILGGECGVTRDADILFLAAPNGINDALDVLTDLPDDFRFKDRLQVQYIMDACENAVDRGFQGTDRYCDRFGNALETTENTYVDLLSRLRDAARTMRTERDANQVAVLFVDDQSLQANRFGILREARNIATFDGIQIVVVDLGVRQFGNFVSGLAQNPDDVIDYFAQGQSQSRRRLLDRICENINGFGVVQPV